jgi:outer membrane receptor protein involved in Fe transport
LERTITSILLLILVIAVSGRAQSLIKGSVQDENGATIAGASVYFVASGSQTSRNTVTDPSGKFEIDAGPKARGILTVEANGFLRAEKTLTVAGPVTHVSFILSPVPISAEISITRSDTRIEETPASVVALSDRELDLTAAQTLDDKLRQVPGFSLFRRAGSRTANPTTQGVSLRGVGPSGASRALVLLDGVPLNDPFGGWIYWGRVPSESISQVEILRGAASDLYGGSAVGGVVALTTKKPLEDATASIQLSYGSFNTPSASGFASASAGKWRGSIGAEALRTGGYVTVAEEDRGPVDVPANVRYLTLAPEIEYNFDSQRRLFASAVYFREKRGNGTPLQFNDTRIRNVVIGADLRTTRTGDLALRGYIASQVYDQSFTAVSANRVSEFLLRRQRVPSQVTGFNALWNKTVGKNVTLFIGSDGRETRGRSDETVFVGSRITSLVSAGGRELTIGAFIGGSVALGSRFVFSGGVRIDHWRNFAGYSATRSFTTGQDELTEFADRSEWAFSPRLSALVRINDHFSLSGTFSTGFRQPTLNELYRSFRVGNVLTLANEDLRAEHAVNGEAGAVYSAFDRRLFIRGNIFCTQISRPVANVTLLITPTLITRQRQNLGSLRSCGLEADWEAALPSNLRFSGGYLFVDPRVTSFPANILLEGLQIPQVARHQLSMQLQYTNEKYALIGIQMRAASSQFDDDQNLFRLKEYLVTDAIVRRKIHSGISVFTAVENLFDARIETGRTPLLTLAAPRSFRIGLRIEFTRR